MPRALLNDAFADAHFWFAQTPVTPAAQAPSWPSAGDGSGERHPLTLPTHTDSHTDPRTHTPSPHSLTHPNTHTSYNTHIPPNIHSHKPQYACPWNPPPRVPQYTHPNTTHPNTHTQYIYSPHSRTPPTNSHTHTHKHTSPNTHTLHTHTRYSHRRTSNTFTHTAHSNTHLPTAHTRRTWTPISPHTDRTRARTSTQHSATRPAVALPSPAWPLLGTAGGQPGERPSQTQPQRPLSLRSRCPAGSLS